MLKLFTLISLRFFFFVGFVIASIQEFYFDKTFTTIVYFMKEISVLKLMVFSLITSWLVPSSVPRGSYLSTLLFLVFVNGLPFVLSYYQFLILQMISTFYFK